MKPFKFKIMILSIGLILGLAGTGLAQCWFIPRPIPPEIPNPVPLEFPVLEKETIHFSVQEQLGKITLEQVWKNPFDHPIEGRLIFPLPPDARVTHFEMTVNDTVFSGKLYNRVKARRIYEKIVRRLRDPGLLEYFNDRLFQTEIFPVPAGQTRRISVNYQAVFPFDQNMVTLKLPLFVQKFAWRRNEQILPKRTLVISGVVRSKSPLKTIYSPNSGVDILQRSDHEAKVSFEGTLSDQKKKEFRLIYSLQKDPVGLSLLTFRKPNTRGYFLLLASPSIDQNQKQSSPTDFVFLLDRSGSMSGEKIEQAKKALKYCLNHLKSNDRFGLVTFSSDVEAFKGELLPIKTWRGKALHFVDQIDARGGTNIQGALESLKRFRGDSTRPLEVIFLTDGKPTLGVTDESELLESFRKETKPNFRLFVFGVGFDVNTFLLNHLSQEGHGTVVYVEPESNLEVKISSFFNKVKAPVLTNISLNWGGQSVQEVLPKELPDLFQGGQLIVAGTYKKSGTFQIGLKGRFRGQTRIFKRKFNFPEAANENDFVPVIWASRKIGFLLDEIRWHGENEELKNEVIRLSKKFGIVTPYTSYLIREPEQPLVLQPTAGTPPTPQPPRFNRSKKIFLQDFVNKGAEVSGASSFYISKSIQNLQQSRVVSSESEADLVEFVAGRSFIFADSIWVDQRVESKSADVTVAFGSPAYFDLLKWHPEMAEFFALGRAVKFKFAGVVFQISENGKEKWSSNESEKYRRLAP